MKRGDFAEAGTIVFSALTPTKKPSVVPVGATRTMSLSTLRRNVSSNLPRS
jgi:hypothetical protein